MLIVTSVMNGVGLVGRLVPAYLADQYFGPLNTLIPFVLTSGLLIYCWAAVVSPGTCPSRSTRKQCIRLFVRPVPCILSHEVAAL